MCSCALIRDTLQLTIVKNDLYYMSCRLASEKEADENRYHGGHF